MTAESGVIRASPVPLTCANGRRVHPFPAWALPSDLRKRASLPPVLYRERFTVFAWTAWTVPSDLRKRASFLGPAPGPSLDMPGPERGGRGRAGPSTVQAKNLCLDRIRGMSLQVRGSRSKQVQAVQAISETFPCARACIYAHACMRVRAHTRARARERWGTYRPFRSSTGHLSTDRIPPPCCSKSLSRKRPDTTSPAEPEETPR
jgi:hypothetical protein